MHPPLGKPPRQQVFDESNDSHKKKNIKEEKNLLENELDKLDINKTNF